MKKAIVFAVDDNYVIPFIVLFASLEATKSIPSNVLVFILHDASLSSASILEIANHLSFYKRTPLFKNIGNLIPEDLPIKDSDHVSKATFYRLFIADILPQDITYAVYLDCDMIAMRSIKPLFSKPPKDLLAAVDHFTPSNELRLWGPTGGTYFQGGLLVISVQQWREKKLKSKFIDVMRTQRERIQWWDQDVLNIVFRKRWERIPVWYNVSGPVVNELGIETIKANGRLIHFTGRSKPWDSDSQSPFAEDWRLNYLKAYGKEYKPKKISYSRVSRFLRAIKTEIDSINFLTRHRPT